jgi:phospholipase C
MMKTICTSLLALGISTIAAQAQIRAFQHVVVIIQENRTPDNLFQGLCSPSSRCSTTPNAHQYNIQTSNWLDKHSPTGVTQPAPVPLANSYVPAHSHMAFVKMCDAYPTTGACRMDGADDISCSGVCPAKPQFKFVDNSTGILNPYLALATQYGWANYMFQTNQGPSFPAHQFLFGGTSAPSALDDAQAIFAYENPFSSQSGLASVAGCTAPSDSTVPLITPSGQTIGIYPCFEHNTMADLGFTWKYYAPPKGLTGLTASYWTAPNAIQHICQSSGAGGICTGTAWSKNVDLNPVDVLKDIANCQLRSVSWVVPTGANSDHGPNEGGGPSWVASIVNAIGSSNACDNNTGYWNNTAIFITWDDWGGWYDHEPPTIMYGPHGDYQYGFRVPLLVVSPYTPSGYINNARQDFGRILRFIEHNFGIREGALNFADARARSDLTLFFNLNTAPRAFQKIAAPKDAAFFLEDRRPATDPDDD